MWWAGKGGVQEAETLSRKWTLKAAAQAAHLAAKLKKVTIENLDSMLDSESEEEGRQASLVLIDDIADRLEAGRFSTASDRAEELGAEARQLSSLGFGVGISVFRAMNKFRNIQLHTRHSSFERTSEWMNSSSSSGSRRLSRGSIAISQVWGDNDEDEMDEQEPEGAGGLEEEEEVEPRRMNTLPPLRSQVRVIPVHPEQSEERRTLRFDEDATDTCSASQINANRTEGPGPGSAPAAWNSQPPP